MLARGRLGNGRRNQFDLICRVRQVFHLRHSIARNPNSAVLITCAAGGQFLYFFQARHMVEHAVVKLYDGAFVDAGVAVYLGSVKPFPRLNGADVLRAEKSNVVRHDRTAFERLRRRLQKRFDLRRPAFEIVGKLDCGI